MADSVSVVIRLNVSGHRRTVTYDDRLDMTAAPHKRAAQLRALTDEATEDVVALITRKINR